MAYSPAALLHYIATGYGIQASHRWEKNPTQINPYLDTDVTVKEYLDKLEARGEDPEDYRSIWCYY